MTYRELIIELMDLPPSALDQNIIIFNEEDNKFYTCTGNDIHISVEDNDPIEPGQFYLMVNI